MLVVLLAAGSFANPKSAKAWNSGWSGGNTLVGFNWDYFQIGYFPYTVESSIYYVKVWEGGVGYTRVESLTHQEKTISNWPSYSENLTGYVVTTLYSGGVFAAEFGYLNGSCLLPPWTYWWCDYGSMSTAFYGNGSGHTVGHMGIGNDGWGTYSGATADGWFYWSY